MKDDLTKAIKTLTESATMCGDSADAMRFTQAALNLAHVAGVLEKVLTLK